MEESHQLLQEHYGTIPLKLIQAALCRPNNDCDLLYLKEAMQKRSVDELYEILSNPNSIALRLIMDRTVKETFIPQKIIEVVIPPPSPQREDEFLNQMVDEWMKMEQTEEKKAVVEPEEEQEQPEVETQDLVWRTTIAHHPWARTIWLRVNGSKLLCRNKKRDTLLQRKIEMFIDAHLQCVQQVDAGQLTDFTYKQLGPSYFISDRHFSIFALPRNVQVRADPLDEIKAAFPDQEWNPDILAHEIRTLRFTDLEYGILEPDGVNEWVVIPNAQPHTHSIYLALMTILNNCMRHLLTMPDRRVPIAHSLWVYYVSFMELFYFCGGRMDDIYLLYPIGSQLERGGKVQSSESFSPWTIYGGAYAQRTFDAYDLPDLMGMIADIPLWGILHTPDFDLGKCYQKSLPFACQRRCLFTLVKRCVEHTSSFWPVFSKICWVMMADLYPGPIASTKQHLSMRDLLRIRELTDSREKMLSIFTAGGKDSGGPLIIFSTFRLHIIHLALHDSEYMKEASACIDWAHFEQDAATLAEIIRENRFFSDDVFAQARAHLSKTSSKSLQTHVFRMHRTSLSVNLSSEMSKCLKKYVLTNRLNRAADRKTLRTLVENECWDRLEFNKTHIAKEIGPVEMTDLKQCMIAALNVCNKAYEHFNKHFHFPEKSAILNALLKIPNHLRFTRDAFSILRDPKYGGASERIVSDLVQLVHIYHIKRGAPKEYVPCIKNMRTRDFIVGYYYVTMAAQLDRISFVILDEDTVKRTDNAIINKRHHLTENDPYCESFYDVYISLCCRRICSMMGKGRFGERKVAYDMERECYVCTYGMSVNNNASADSKVNAHTTATHNASTFHQDASDDEEEDSDDAAPLQNAEEADAEDMDEIMSYLPEDMGGGNGFEPKKKRAKKKHEEEIKILDPEDEFKRKIRKECKSLNTIPCGQAVIKYNLRGRAMLWRVKAQEIVRIQHCPQCGSLHHFKMHGFSGSPEYRCTECAHLDLYDEYPMQCAYHCDEMIPSRLIEKRTLEIFCTEVDPSNPNHNLLLYPEHCIQRLVFCDSHYKLAWYLIHKGITNKETIWKMIYKAQQTRASRGIGMSKMK